MPKVPPHIFWPGFVIALLLMSATMVTITVVAATNDPSFAVVDNYYEKGLHWDDHMAQLEKNKALGWAARPEVGAAAGADLRPLSITLTDRDGAPIEGASIEASVFHFTTAHRVETESLAATGTPGVYSAPFLIDREGKWMLDLTVHAGAETFTSRQTLDLSWN